jgi:uncharacterized membrane protein YgdD (TMEM256/DUF423 family)
LSEKTHLTADEGKVTFRAMTSTTALRISALTGCLAVALGAFGAHGLEKMLAGLAPEQAAKQLDWWKTAVAYHLPHAVAMLAVAFVAPLRTWSWSLFLGGIVLFSGTLYAMALGAPRWLGAITPIGGILLIAGWLALAFAKPPRA